MKNILNNRWLSVIGIIIIIANIATLALLWDRKKPIHSPRLEIKGSVFDYLTKELQLDSAQKEAYRKLKEEHQKGQPALQDTIRKTKDAFFALLKKANVTEAELQDKSSAAAKADEQFDLYTFKHFQKVRAICTPGQQQKFDSVIQGVLWRMAPKQGGPQAGRPPRNERDDSNNLNEPQSRPVPVNDSLRRRFKPDSLRRRNHPPPGDRPPGNWPPPHDGPPGDRRPPRDGPPGDRPPPPDDRPPPGDRPPPPPNN